MTLPKLVPNNSRKTNENDGLSGNDRRKRRNRISWWLIGDSRSPANAGDAQALCIWRVRRDGPSACRRFAPRWELPTAWFV